MKKTNEKKINWKNVAIIGGVFVLGVATGVIGGRKVLDYMIENEDVILETTKGFVHGGKQGIKMVMKCKKAGIELPMELDRLSVENMLDMIDGKPFDLERFFMQDI